MVPTSSPGSVKPGWTNGLRHCCGSDVAVGLSHGPLGAALGSAPAHPSAWYSVAPRWPGEVVHPVAAWATPTEGHEEWNPRDSLLMAVYRFPCGLGVLAASRAVPALTHWWGDGLRVQRVPGGGSARVTTGSLHCVSLVTLGKLCLWCAGCLQVVLAPGLPADTCGGTAVWGRNQKVRGRHTLRAFAEVRLCFSTHI